MSPLLLTGAVLMAVLYGGVGIGIVLASLMSPHFAAVVERLASEHDMSRRYGWAMWCIGTLLMWPVGLWVFATGKLVMPGRKDDLDLASLEKAYDIFQTRLGAPHRPAYGEPHHVILDASEDQVKQALAAALELREADEPAAQPSDILRIEAGL